MQPLIWESRPDGLRAPALVCAFTGWNDAGDAASAAVQFIGSSLGATRFARIDPEEFFDFQATRPRVAFTEGRTREVEWPSVEVFAARVPRAPRDLVLLQGPEPSMRWRTFTRLIVELAEALGTQMVVSLGALLADVPHTRPGRASPGWRATRRSSTALGMTGSDYEGPTGHRRRAARGLPGRRAPVGVAVGQRAALRRRRAEPEGRPRARAQARGRSSACPSTPRSSSRPRPTTSARCRSPCRATRTSRPSSSAWSRRRPRRSPSCDPQDLPSGDVLAREFQRFLRQRGPGAARPAPAAARPARARSGPGAPASARRGPPRPRCRGRGGARRSATSPRARPPGGSPGGRPRTRAGPACRARRPRRGSR